MKNLSLSLVIVFALAAAASAGPKAARVDEVPKASAVDYSWIEVKSHRLSSGEFATSIQVQVWGENLDDLAAEKTLDAIGAAWLQFPCASLFRVDVYLAGRSWKSDANRSTKKDMTPGSGWPWYAMKRWVAKAGGGKLSDEEDQAQGWTTGGKELDVKAAKAGEVAAGKARFQDDNRHLDGPRPIVR